MQLPMLIQCWCSQGDFLHALTSLEKLNLAQNEISDLLGKTFQHNAALKDLSLAQNSLAGAGLHIESFYGLVRSVDFVFTRTCKTMEVLIWGYWSASLQRLSLKANAAISVFERAWARDLQELEFLNLEDCQLSSFPDVSSMLNLQELVLANNPIQVCRGPRTAFLRHFPRHKIY